MQYLKILFIGSCLVCLVACGGSSNSDSTPKSLSGKVIDGYIQGAQVCLDVNNNLACDAGEPSTTSGADGSYAFTYSGSISGKHILAVVDAGAIDLDSGPVIEPFSLLAPAESSKTVTPLSTLVSHEMISIGTTTTEATANVKAEFKFDKDPLNYDFKALSDNETLKLAQAVAAGIAMANNTLKNQPAIANALTPNQIMKAAIKEVKENILPGMIKSDGTVDAPVCHPNCNQSQLTAHISNRASSELTAISGRIQTIVAQSKSGNGLVASFSDVFSKGLSVLSFRSGDYYMDSNRSQIGVYTKELKAELYTLTNTSLNRVPKVMINRQWFEAFETQEDFVTLWDGTKWLEFIDDSDFGGVPAIEGNCVSLIKTGSLEKLQKACIVAKDVSGQKMSDVFPDICKNNDDTPVLNCNGSALLPPGSYGYEMGFQNLKLSVEFQVDNNRLGYANTISELIRSTTAATPHTLGDNGNICFYFSTTSANSGTVHWAAKENSCITSLTLYTEKTGYTIETIGGREVLIADVPSVFKKLNPRGLQNGCKFAFAKAKNINGNADTVMGVHQGDYCGANSRSTIPFNGDVRNGMQFISLSLLNFLLTQRDLPVWQ
jgi:hypothetical protein